MRYVGYFCLGLLWFVDGPVDTLRVQSPWDGYVPLISWERPRWVVIIEHEEVYPGQWETRDMKEGGITSWVWCESRPPPDTLRVEMVR